MPTLAQVLRDRRRSRQNPAYPLDPTHKYEDSAGTLEIDAATEFPDRTRPITIAVEVEITGASPDGWILEIGSGANQLALWLENSASEVRCAVGDGGVSGSYARVEFSASLGIGQILKLVVAIVPGAGELKVWEHGRFKGADVASNGFPSDEWNDGTPGAWGRRQGPGSLHNTTADTPLTDARILWPGRIYQGQLPLQYAVG